MRKCSIAYFDNEPKRATDFSNVDYFYEGMFGDYRAVLFSIQQQGAAKSDNAQMSVFRAIQDFRPDAVILLGEAIGIDDLSDDGHNTIAECNQKVLISDRIVDYENGIQIDGSIQSDAAVPEAGRHLLSVFRHLAEEWKKKDTEHRDYKIGAVLSGDKEIRDTSYYTMLKKNYPLAIGIERNARSTYAACHAANIYEWIVVDGYNYFGNCHEEPKPFDTVVSLLEFVFGSKQAFEQFEKERFGSLTTRSDFIGYCIGFGLNSCRVFQIVKDGKKRGKLKEYKLFSYANNTATKGSIEYWKGIISTVESRIAPIIKQSGKHVYYKAFADASFEDVFTSKNNQLQKADFIAELYDKTGIYFNVLTQKQTETNMRKIYNSKDDIRAVINIGASGIEMLANVAKPKALRASFQMINIDFSLDDLENYVINQKIGKVWSDQDISNIRGYIKKKLLSQQKKIGIQLTEIYADKVVIIKNERQFMRELKYDLKNDGARDTIDIETYKSNNRNILFSIDYEEYLKKHFPEAEVKRLFGFRYGHILLQSLFELIHTEVIIPSDEISIHGSKDAYIFNVVVSGSTSDENVQYMIDAVNALDAAGLNVISPRIVNNKLEEITKKTNRDHAKAIRECDLLFVSNGNGYIGEQTKCEIYGAYIANKPIAFMVEPPPEASTEKGSHLEFIPHEIWGQNYLDIDS